jgi:hypothetical protein
MEVRWDAILNALIGSGISAALAKAFIAKSLRDLEKVSEKVIQIKTELSAIAVKLEHADKDHEILLKHERKIAAMENEVYGHGSTACKAFQGV